MSDIHPENDDRLIPQPKIVLEGTHLTRKTDVAFALAEHPDIIGVRQRRWHIPLLSAEWETRSAMAPTKSNPGRSMINFGSDDLEWVIDCYDNLTRLLEPPSGLLLDTRPIPHLDGRPPEAPVWA